jgi:hypothetical protein
MADKRTDPFRVGDYVRVTDNRGSFTGHVTTYNNGVVFVKCNCCGVGRITEEKFVELT